MNIFYKFLTLKGIPFNHRTARDFFSTHPYHPSILSLSDLLDEFKTENAAVEVEEDDLVKVPLPFVAKTSSSEGDFALVTALTGSSVTYLNEKGKWPTTSLDAFKKQFNGVVLVAEKGADSGEENYEVKKKEDYFSAFKKTGLITLCGILLCLFYAFNTMPGVPVLISVLFVVKLSGIALSALLLLHTFDAQNPVLSKLCSSASGNGCNDILSSEGSKIFNGKLSWSEIGFFYFSVTALAMILNGSGGGLSLILWLNVACLPYTFYSIWFQKYVAKSWCRLCLAVQGILWLEFLAGISQFPLYKYQATFRDVALLSGIGLFIVTLWLIIKPLISLSVKVDGLSRVANKFKKNEFIFQTLLQSQDQADIQSAAPLIFGNPEARYEITIISNPFCQPCMIAHQEIKGLMEQCPGKLKVSVIFISTGDESSQRDQVINAMISCYLDYGPQQFQLLMDSWYDSGQKNVARWLEKHGTQPAKSEMFKPIIVSQIEWCVSHNISHTPTLYINGYKAIPEYGLSDLKPFLSLA